MSAFVGTTADAAAVSTGRPVEQVAPETSLNFDGGVRFHNATRARASSRRSSTRSTATSRSWRSSCRRARWARRSAASRSRRRPPTARCSSPLSTTPVLVRANFDEARIWGLEWLGEFKLTQSTHGRHRPTPTCARRTRTPACRRTSRAARRRRAARCGSATPGPARSGGCEPYVAFAARADAPVVARHQRPPHGRHADRDRRSRTTSVAARRSTAGSRPGPDGTFGNADDILIATGETLAQVQDRVLGVGVNSAPLFTAVPSYVLCGVRFGLSLGPHIRSSSTPRTSATRATAASAGAWTGRAGGFPSDTWRAGSRNTGVPRRRRPPRCPSLAGCHRRLVSCRNTFLLVRRRSARARQTSGMQQSLEVPRPFLETGRCAARRFGDLADGNPR